jgi:hypothetical protein
MTKYSLPEPDDEGVGTGTGRRKRRVDRRPSFRSVVKAFHRDRPTSSRREPFLQISASGLSRTAGSRLWTTEPHATCEPKSFSRTLQRSSESANVRRAARQFKETFSPKRLPSIPNVRGRASSEIEKGTMASRRGTTRHCGIKLLLFSLAWPPEVNSAWLCVDSGG